MKKYLFFILVFIIFGCNQNKIITQNALYNCYITYPIYNNSNLETARYIGNIKQLPYEVKIKDIFDKKRIPFDSACQYVTSYRHQKRIFFNYDCSLNLQYPDSCFLKKIFIDSEQTTLPISFSIDFIKKERKSIINLGETNVYYYQLKNIPSASSDRITIFLKEKINNKYKEDLEGFVISSDGLEWEEKEGIATPIFIEKTRENLYKIPLYYDTLRFIPVGYYNINTILQK
jgi:hypothetical protein